MSFSFVDEPEPTAVGVDVVTMSRIERALARNVFDSVCHPDELENRILTVISAARIWTAKEATVKTLGTGFWQAGVDFPEVRISCDWTVTLHGNAKRLAPNARFEVDFFEGENAMFALALRFEETTQNSGAGAAEATCGSIPSS